MTRYGGPRRLQSPRHHHGEGRSPKIGLKGLSLLAIGLVASLLTCVKVWGWGSKPHSQIVDAALTVIPWQDGLLTRLQGEAGNLRNDVQMGDWVNSFVQLFETWRLDRQDYPQVGAEYFANDYLIFPEAPRTFNHSVPDVMNTYTPFFLRALQALRTETPMNAGRWTGSLLHFVTDSGSPPHTIGLKGLDHLRMENWLDASQIDIAGYHPVLLGSTDSSAVRGLTERMQALIAENSVVARRMVPFAESGDRSHVEPLAMECATETAKVTADVIHTLLILAARVPPSDSGSITASISAPPAPFPLLPAKLVLLGTDYSTLSEGLSAAGKRYQGSFTLHHLPPGTYRAAIERLGAETLITDPFTVAKNRDSHFSWQMKPSAPQNNLVRNPDFKLHWIAKSAPDHWHFDAKENCWLSDDVPVSAGKIYDFWTKVRSGPKLDVAIQWMHWSWDPVKVSPSIFVRAGSEESPAQVTAPQEAIYARLRVSSVNPPEAGLANVVLTEEESSAGINHQ